MCVYAELMAHVVGRRTSMAMARDWRRGRLIILYFDFSYFVLLIFIKFESMLHQIPCNENHLSIHFNECN